MTAKAIINYQKNSQQFQLTDQNTWLLWCCQLINIASLSAEISTWMLAILALCLCWQALFYSRKVNSGKINTKSSIKTNTKDNARISPLLLTIFALSGCVAIAITASNLGVLISMVHLLTFAYTLKAFEIKQRKDFYQVFLLGLFLLASAFIFKQDLVFSLFVALALSLNLMVLLQVFSPKQSVFSSAKTVVMLLLQSSILAIVLFVVFPRLSPFWQVPNAQSAQTGLSDEVSPGDIANLALSNDLAFRVDFQGSDIPRYSSLYWRAMTLENYDGRKWSRVKNKEKHSNKNKPSLSDKPFIPLTSGKGIAYNIIVEPSNQTWLFGLSVAISDDPKLRLINDYTIQSRTVLSQLSHYQVESYLQAPLDLLMSKMKKQRNLTIIKGSNPKLEHLALALIQKYPDPIDRSNAVLTLFRNQEYFYTLKPPLLINNSLDQFFFDTKAGFCVHYASAYTYLMRAAGIPARIVTGYLGGEYNDASSAQKSKQGGHLSIYQYDAHAWAEIWLEGIGWQRVDPTAAVDPQRVDSGWSTALLSQQSSLNNDFLGLYQFKKIAWLNTLRLQLDALDYQWTRWVLGYSSKQQYDLLKRWFGEELQFKAAILVVSSLITMMVLFTLIYRFNFTLFKRKKSPPWIKLYQQTLQKLAKKGLIKPADMTPADFAQIVAQQNPEISKQFLEFTATFELLMFKKLNSKLQEIYLVRLKYQYVRLD
tara:strand:- start:51453 stop:53573 length:2121 start_codon:yes stop_codon:yes gene_type:complete